MLHRSQLIASALFLLTSFASAQVPVKEPPQEVSLGRLQADASGGMRLDGQPARPAPDLLVRSARGRTAPAAALSREEVPVLYRRDDAGHVNRVWLLTEAEYARLAGSQGTEFKNLLAQIFNERVAR